MKDGQWEELLAVVGGNAPERPPVAFIIDSPWLPNWAGMSILDYYTSESKWLEANLRAIEQFPDIWFLPGFWSEYGMCTEPSAFGAKCIFHENEFPFAEKLSDGDYMMGDLSAFQRVKKPNPATDGLAPFTLQRLKQCQPRIEEQGHKIRFAVARGPLNIAGFLVGNSEFLMALRMQPDEAHGLLRIVTDYLVEWVQLQAQTFPSIDGLFFLDDLVGFCGEDDVLTFAKPYMKEIFEAIDASVRFFHNDAKGVVCAPHLADVGVNLFNFSHQHPMAEMKALAGDSVTLLGNIPPRDVLAQGSPDDVRKSVAELLASVEETRGIILSCGGGMPPGVPTENIEAFLEAAGHARA